MKTAVLLLTVCAVLGRAADTADPYGVKGISVVGLVIEDLSPRAAKIGLTSDAIRTDVELRLRTAGLRIVDTDTWIHVSVTVVDRAAAVIVELQQPVAPIRDSLRSVISAATTWSSGTVLSNPSEDGIRSVVKDKIDKFLNEWLKQNPRR